MLSIKHITTSALSALISAPVLTLVSILNVTSVYAGNNEHNRQEPIFPLPQQVEVDAGKAELGETLFSDVRLSRDRNVACSSCHHLDTGGDDDVALGLSSSAEQHIINTPSIFNARYNFRQNWDGSSKTLYDQINTVMKNHHEFNSQWDNIVSRLSLDKVFKEKFKQSYKEGLSKDNIIDAIVEFENTLITPDSRFDRYLRNEDDTLTRNELEGYRVFKELGCISCHQGINIGGNLYQKFGVFYNYLAERGNINKLDYGRMNITHRPMDAFVFKVPSLRNVAVTAPYLHDGSAETIEQAISIMGKTQLGRILTEDEVFLIKSFLNTLTGRYKNRPLDGTS
ncbi:MAG TPA: c-type cytochrome [Gammaproteobacteria bacterium]|nr:c-type cytochrome [Gammaproteobacteria bacterium]